MGAASQFLFCPRVADSKDFPYNASFAAFCLQGFFLFELVGLVVVLKNSTGPAVEQVRQEPGGGEAGHFVQLARN